MSREEWDAMSLEERVEWLYRKSEELEPTQPSPLHAGGLGQARE